MQNSNHFKVIKCIPRNNIYQNVKKYIYKHLFPNEEDKLIAINIQTIVAYNSDIVDFYHIILDKH